MLVEAFRYNRWANLLLVDTCAAMPSSQLQLTTPGTYGTIAATLTHLVAAERWYVWLATGMHGRFRRHRKFPGLPLLMKLAAESGDALIAAAPTIKERDVIEVREHGWVERIHKSVILTQALHHRNDHRTHVCTILGAHGLTVPDLDAWAYGMATKRTILSRVKP